MMLALLVQQNRAQTQKRAGEQQRRRRHAVDVQFAENARRNVVSGQAKQHPPCGEHPAVGRGQRRSQHHQVNQAGGNRDANHGKHVHKRAYFGIDHIPRRNRHNHRQSQHIKTQSRGWECG